MGTDARERELSVSALTRDRDFPCTVVSLAGQAGIGDCGWIRWLLELPAAQARGRLVVDLSRLSSMDWWVAIILAWAGRVLSRRGGVLVLASPPPDVARLLDATGTSKVVAVYGSVQQAAGNVAARPSASAV